MKDYFRITVEFVPATTSNFDGYQRRWKKEFKGPLLKPLLAEATKHFSRKRTAVARKPTEVR